MESGTWIAAIIFALVTKFTEQSSPVPCNVTVTHNSEVIFLTNDSVVYNCSIGYIQSDGNTHLQCNPDGFWNGRELFCSPVDCGPPQILDNIETDYTAGTNTTRTRYGERIEFVCSEGTRRAGQYWGEFVCREDGQWTLNGTDYVGEMSCKSIDVYMGCYAAESFVVISQFPQSSTCRSKCKTENSRYVGLAADTCYCGDILNGSAIQNSSYCNVTCPFRIKESPYYCGGPSGYLSVYTSRSTISTDLTSVEGFQFSLSTTVYGEGELTCKQLCQAEEAYYAVLQDTECMCTNTTYSPVTGNSSSISNASLIMYNLAKYSYREKHCSDLYDKKVRNHGWYYLQNKASPEYCRFSDGTPCDEGWVGYSGSCYWFETKKMNFTDSASHCATLNSSLAPLHSQEVMTFVKQFLQNYHSDLYSTSWRFGATDVHAVSYYEWLDGSLSKESFFRSGRPEKDAYDCLYFHKGLWIDNGCDFEASFICSREPARFRCVEYDLSTSTDVGLYKYTNEKMTRQLCIQVCGGRYSANILLKGKDCVCTNSSVESYVTYLSESACASHCPGNVHQVCGGGTEYSFKENLNGKRATNCMELENQGIGNITVMLWNTSQPTYCPQAECPFSWIKRPGYSSCYKFGFQLISKQGALQYCSSYHSVLAVVDDDEERTFLQDVLTSVESFTPTWFRAIGMKSTSKYSTTYIRTSTGRRLGNVTLEYHDGINNQNAHLYYVGNIQLLKSTNKKFICEKTPEYVGCFTSDSSLPVTWTSDDMTVELCVEICRPLNMTYAVLSPTQCRCNGTLSVTKAKDCTSTCANSEYQICGNSDSSVSVFRIDEYPLYGSCDELFDSGIRKHGSYILMNGTQTCQFYDNSAVCEDGWYAMNGTCYTVLLSPTTGVEYQNVDDWKSACGQKGGRLVTINNEKQQQLIAKIIMGSERLVKPTVLIGYSESILLGAPTWTSGSLSEYLKDQTVTDISYQQRVLYEDQQYLNTIISTSTEAALAEAAVCETEKDFIGVFNPPTHLGASILRYGIMTLTQCKQVCIGANHTFAILGKDTCWCGNQTDVDLLTPDASGTIDRTINASQMYCSGNEIQHCPANRDTVDVYSIEFDLEFPASSCDHLYSHGVFYKATYKIQNGNETSYQTCGFTDNTDCGPVPRFVGYNGRCYKFGTVMTYGASCLSTDSFPILPSEDNELITTLKQIVPVFKNDMSIVIGTSNRLQNGYLTTSEGFFLKSHPAVATSCLETFMTLNLSSMIWEEASGMQYEICKAPQNGSIICIDTSSLNGTIVFEQRDIHPMTSSICIHLCLGRDSSHAVVHEKGCQCYNSISYKRKFGKCMVCSGHETQMCGDESTGSGALVDLGFYRNETAQSCEELYSYGIQIPGQYYIKPNNTRYLVRCFDQYPSLSVVTGYSATPSSLYPGLSNEGFRINVYSNYCVDNSWTPDYSDLDPHLDFTFTEDYIITAIQTQGDVLSESWVQSYRLMYKNMEKKDASITIAGSTIIAGNVDSHSRVTQFFPLPVITQKLTLYPQSFQQDESLRVALYGQPLSQFNHSSRYLGCILDVEGEFIQTSLINSDGTCRSTCRASYHQFYSYYEKNSTKHCMCGKSLPVFGRTQESRCFPYPRTPSLPVYRTYDTYCAARSEENANLVSSELPHSHNIYSLSSKLKYECDDGYILANNATSKTVICRESNGSYYWQDDAGICLVKNCSSLNQSNAWYNLSTSSVAFRTNVTVTCTNSLYMADGSNTKTLTCLSTALWNDTVTPCNYNYCPLLPSALTNGKYVLSQDGSSATYSCNQFYQLSSKSNQETITCQQNHLWENINFTCGINDTNVAFRQAEFDLVGLFDRQRNARSVISDSASSSLFKCTDKCLKNAHCTAYSYSGSERVCILFNSRAQAVELVHAATWKYFELNSLFME